jgi:hypothetical protein
LETILMRSFIFVLMLAAFCTAQSLPTLPNLTSVDREAYVTISRRISGLRMSVTWEGITLGEVRKDLARRLGINLVIDKSVADKAEEPIDLTLKDVSARTVLRQLEDALGVVFQHRHGVVVITTQEDALTRSMVLRLHEIRLILYEPPDFPPPVELGLRPGRPLELPEEPEPKEGMSKDFLVDLVRSATGGPEVWDVPGASLVAENGILFVRHAPHVQGRVARLLARLR